MPATPVKFKQALAPVIDPKAIALGISGHFSKYTSAFGHYRSYTKWKLRTDPLYEAVRKLLQGTSLPVLDIGCGLGLLAFYLRESGMHSPVHGLDFDSKKIRLARKVASRYSGLHFDTVDVRQSWPGIQGHLCLLDVLQYLTAPDGAALLRRCAGHVAPGGQLIIRSPLRENTWRGAFTRQTDRWANIITWMKSVPRHYPTREELEEPLAAEGLHLLEARPLWGRTPFNTYLLVFARPVVGGSTQE